jgi:hypothetical protein
MKKKLLQRTSETALLNDGLSLTPVLLDELTSALKSPHSWLRV